MIYEELKILRALNNKKDTITQDKEYVILDRKDNRILVKNNEGALEWVSESLFCDKKEMQILSPIKNVVYLGESKNALTQGVPYSFFKQKSDSYYIFNDTYEFKWYNSSMFKFTSEYKPEHIEEYMKNSAKSLEDKPIIKTAIKIPLKGEPKILKFNIIILTITYGLIRNLDLYKSLIISSIIGIVIIVKNIEMLHKLFIVRKYNNEVELRNNEFIENARLYSMLNPDILAKLTAIENRVSNISNDVIIGNAFMNSMTGYILNWIKLSENNGTVPESTSKLICDYIESCNKYLDEHYLTISKDRALLSGKLEQMANKEIQKQTNLIDSATEDLRNIRNNINNIDSSN